MSFAIVGASFLALLALTLTLLHRGWRLRP
jgi:hypothetical protein